MESGKQASVNLCKLFEFILFVVLALEKLALIITAEAISNVSSKFYSLKQLILQ